MKITLITSWFDEKADWLYEAISSVAGICSHVVAVDGAYALYPDAKGRSHPDQAQAITLAAREHNLGLTLYQSSMPWHGNEIEKRDVMFQLAALTDPDWMLILDGDERVIEVPPDLHESLSAPWDVIAVQHLLMPEGQMGQCRKLYRPPLRVGTFHAEYLNPQGIDVATAEPCPLLEGFVVEHRKRERLPLRAQAASEYYSRRDAEGIEEPP